jgi:hypothetical protein
VLCAPDDVSLLRADETVFDAMLDGWPAQMLARGLEIDSIKARCRVIARFVDFTNEYPWRWRANDVDQFLAELRVAALLRLRGGHSFRQIDSIFTALPSVILICLKGLATDIHV